MGREKGSRKGDIGPQGTIRWTERDRMMMFTVQRHLMGRFGASVRPSQADIIRYSLRTTYRALERLRRKGAADTREGG